MAEKSNSRGWKRNLIELKPEKTNPLDALDVWEEFIALKVRFYASSTQHYVYSVINHDI